MQTTVPVAVAMIGFMCYCQLSWAFYNPFGENSGPPRLPRCTESSQPCRLRAELVENNPHRAPEDQMRRVIGNHLCACPRSSPCSEDWSPGNGKVISRELRTNGNINMTLSMMFCVPVHLDPNQQRWCQAGEVALRLKGMSSVPTELEHVACRCTDSRPLVLHRRFMGMDFRQYDDYVCANHKRRCNVEWNPDVCLIYTPENGTDFFPCKCPDHTVCRSTSDIPANKDFRCLALQ